MRLLDNLYNPVENSIMTVLIIYDSMFGNTQKIAEAMASAFAAPDAVRVLPVKEAKVEDLANVDLLIVGSPTQGGRPMPDIAQLLAQVTRNALKNVSAAAFDTRFLENNQNIALRLLMKTIGDAAPKVAGLLKKKGGKLIAPPEGFIVNGKEGPLADGELERAKQWAKNLKLALIRAK